MNKAFKNIIEKIEAVKGALYRGHAYHKWELLPSIGRCEHENNVIEIMETDINAKFKERAIRFLNIKPTNHWQWLFIEQHYGLPTRLLDWTENPLVSLYFACELDVDNAAVDGAVFVVDAPEYLENYENYGGGKVLKDIFVKPTMLDNRMVTQSSRFLAFEDPKMPYNKANKILIPAADKNAILEQLDTYGINSDYIYPDFEGVCLSLKNRWKNLEKLYDIL